MKKISRKEFEACSEGAKVLEKDRYGKKVLQLRDGTFLKLFRRKSWLSKTAFYPPAKRFAANAAKLQRLEIRCPVVLGLYQMSAPYRSIVHYQPLDGALGLIDISDMRCLGKPLSRRLRARNYRHLLRYEDDWALVHPQVRTTFQL